MKVPILQVTGAAVLTAAAILSARADYPGTVLSQGPAAYYRLNETTQPSPTLPAAVNIGSVGAAGNGEFVNGVERGVPGAIVSDPSNTAVRMPYSAGNRVRIPNNEAWNSTTAITVEFWAKPGQTNLLACPAASVEFIASPLQRNGWLFYQGDTGLAAGRGWLFRYYNNSSLTGVSGAAVTMDLSTNEWYHVVGVYDGTNIKIYVNGTQAASTVFNTTPRPNSNPDIPLTFGARADGVSGFWDYDGCIDEAAVYTTALSPERIQAHYQAGIAASPATPYRQVVLADAPSGYWRLSEPGDAAAANIGSLGSAANAKVVSPTTVAVAGPTGPGFESGNKAYQFLTGGYVQAPGLNLNTNGVTITCWAKPSGPQPSHAGIVFHRARLATGASGSTAGLKTDAVAGLNLSYNWDGDNATYNWNSAVPLTDGEWNFVALIVQPDRAVIFAPGSASPEPAIRYGSDINHAVLEFEGGTYIGLDPATGAEASLRKFVGAVDEVAIFGRALSIGETYTQYGAAVGNVPPKIFANPVGPVDAVYVGDPLTMTVDAGGTPDITYAWRKNGTPIAGATSSSLTISSLKTSDAGDYTVVVKNAYGQVTSAAASIFSVSDQTTPSFTKDLLVANRTVFPGGSIELDVVAVGGGVSYLWKKDGNPIAGATGPSLSIANVTATDSGVYSVTVSNPMGSIDSATTTIAIAAPVAGSYEEAVAADAPRVWFRMDDPVGSELMLDAMGRHDGIYTNLMGTPVTLGATGALVNNDNTAATFLADDQAWGETYPPPVIMGDYTYECWVRTEDITSTLSPLSSFRSQYGMALWKEAATWRSGDGYGDLDGDVQIRSSAVGGTLAGEWMHFVITYSGSGAHRTYVNGVWDGNAYIDHSRNRNVPMRIGATLRPSAKWYWTGEIDEVAVYNTALSEERIVAHYQAAKFGASVKPFFLREPVTQAVLPSTSVTFESQADGTRPIAYQWFKNGTAIDGATNASYTLTASSTPSGPDQYTVRASSPAGETLSRVATLTVLAPEPASWNATDGNVLHMKFDGNYQDSSGRNNNGTAVGEPTLVAGQLGQALHFNTDSGASAYNYVALGSPADFRFATDVDFSVAYWVRTPAGMTNGDLPFLSSATNSYGNHGLTFAPSYNLGGWSFSLNGIAQVYGADGSINDGNWHHLLHAVNRKGNVVTYLDGVQVDSRSASTLGDVDTTAGIFNIGQDPTGKYVETGEADLDDLGVWRRTLTAYDAYAIHYVGRNRGMSFDAAAPAELAIAIVGANVQVTWQGGGTLQQANSVLGPWSAVAGATSPYSVVPAPGGKFYRVAR